MATINHINNASFPLAAGGISNDPGASGDSYIQFNINGTGEFRCGVDDDASDSFVLSQGSALGTNNTLVITSSGYQTLPLLPRFSVEPSADLTNVTGDGTVYSVVFATENFDVGSNFSSTTFTVPSAGNYYFRVNLKIDQLTTSFTDFILRFNVNSGTLYTLIQYDPSVGYQVSDQIVLNGSLYIDLSASDTVQVELVVSGSTKTVDILYNVNASLFFGYLVN